jgi:hypothetical protein
VRRVIADAARLGITPAEMQQALSEELSAA